MTDRGREREREIRTGREKSDKKSGKRQKNLFE